MEPRSKEFYADLSKKIRENINNGTSCSKLLDKDLFSEILKEAQTNKDSYWWVPAEYDFSFLRKENFLSLDNDTYSIFCAGLSGYLIDYHYGEDITSSFIETIEDILPFLVKLENKVEIKEDYFSSDKVPTKINAAELSLNDECSKKLDKLFDWP